VAAELSRELVGDELYFLHGLDGKPARAELRGALQPLRVVVRAIDVGSEIGQHVRADAAHAIAPAKHARRVDRRRSQCGGRCQSRIDQQTKFILQAIAARRHAVSAGGDYAACVVKAADKGFHPRKGFAVLLQRRTLHVRKPCAQSFERPRYTTLVPGVAIRVGVDDPVLSDQRRLEPGAVSPWCR
jgi:hypothetical protein